MKAWNVSRWMLALAMVATPLLAQSPSDKKTKKPAVVKDSAADLAAIRQAAADFTASFNAGKASEVAAHWTEDGDYTNEDGAVYEGRAAIEQEYAAFFKANKGVRIQIVVDAVKLLSDSAAIEDGRAILDPPPAGAPAITKYTVVHVKVDGKWLMSTVRDTRLETASAYHNVADLEWLIGNWSAEEHGAKMESICRWVANKSFVERKYTVTHADHSTTSGVQLIGFNPQSNQIQSWNFSSDGGLAIGTWTPRENGWSAEVHGTTGSGVGTSAVNILTRLDDNAYTWQSVQRSAGGQSLPDTGEVVLKRQSP